MAIEVVCQCGKRLKAGEQFGGREVKCPFCKRTLTLPTLTKPVVPPPLPQQSAAASGTAGDRREGRHDAPDETLALSDSQAEALEPELFEELGIYDRTYRPSKSIGTQKAARSVENDNASSSDSGKGGVFRIIVGGVLLWIWISNYQSLQTKTRDVYSQSLSEELLMLSLYYGVPGLALAAAGCYVVLAGREPLEGFGCAITAVYAIVAMLVVSPFTTSEDWLDRDSKALGTTFAPLLALANQNLPDKSSYEPTLRGRILPLVRNRPSPRPTPAADRQARQTPKPKTESDMAVLGVQADIELWRSLPMECRPDNVQQVGTLAILDFRWDKTAEWRYKDGGGFHGNEYCGRCDITLVDCATRTVIARKTLLSPASEKPDVRSIGMPNSGNDQPSRGQVVDVLVKWPGIYHGSDRELQSLEQKFASLITLANQNLPDKSVSDVTLHGKVLPLLRVARGPAPPSPWEPVRDEKDADWQEPEELIPKRTKKPVQRKAEVKARPLTKASSELMHYLPVELRPESAAEVTTLVILEYTWEPGIRSSYQSRERQLYRGTCRVTFVDRATRTVIGHKQWWEVFKDDLEDAEPKGFLSSPTDREGDGIESPQPSEAKVIRMVAKLVHR